MNDNYLFRGKRTDNGEWVTGYYITMWHNGHRTHTHQFIIPLDSDMSYGTLLENVLVELDPNTIGRCTGLKDKNGKFIFETDIVKDEENRIFHVAYSMHFQRLHLFPIGKTSPHLEFYRKHGVEIFDWIYP